MFIPFLLLLFGFCYEETVQKNFKLKILRAASVVFFSFSFTCIYNLGSFPLDIRIWYLSKANLIMV